MRNDGRETHIPFSLYLPTRPFMISAMREWSPDESDRRDISSYPVSFSASSASLSMFSRERSLL